MKTIKLAADLEVDAVEFASRANAILGIRDSGKTYTATLIAEQLFEAGIPSFAFDPIGRWRFLKTPGSNGRGFPFVVAGGVAPDLELTPESAPKLIRAAMKAGVSMVIDLYSVKLTKADWRKIVRSSIETILYEGEGHGQRHVFLEEAAEFIPQKIYDGHTYAAVEKLARMGGNVGVGLTLINQRAEEVNKAVLELCDNLLLHRQRGKNSLLSLRKWLEAGNVTPPREITDTLADLPTGECWAWFRELPRPKKIHIARKQSFDPNRRMMTKAQGDLRGTTRAIDVSRFVAEMNAASSRRAVHAEAPSVHKPTPPVRKSTPAVHKTEEDPTVKESEARALRAENAALKETIEAMKKDLAAGKPKGARYSFETGGAEPVPAENGAPLDMDAIYAEVKRRAASDPGVLRILTEKPEINITVQRRRIEADPATTFGQVALLVGRGFFEGPTKPFHALKEITRTTGKKPRDASVYEACDRLTKEGFLTKESDGYQAVPDMKVNIVEAN